MRALPYLNVPPRYSLFFIPVFVLILIAARTPDSASASDPPSVYASSTSGAGYGPSNAIDGDRATFWRPAFDPANRPSASLQLQWITIYFQNPVPFNRVRILWGDVYARSWRIHVSDDDKTWRVLASNFHGAGGAETIDVGSQSARYISLVGYESSSSQGYEVAEIEVLSDPHANPPAGYPKAVSSSDERPDLAAGQAVDGNTATRWSSNFSDTEWIYIDLGAPQVFDQVVLTWEAAYAKKYGIDVSSDALAWKSVTEVMDGAGGTDFLQIGPQTARYVKMRGIERATPWGYSLYEFQVRGHVVAEDSDSGPRAVASSTEGPGLEPLRAIDNDPATRWSSEFSDLQWIYVDFQNPVAFNQLQLNWEAAYGKRYEIDISNDGTDWFPVKRVASGAGGTEWLDVGHQRARFVRMLGLERGTPWGFSLYDMRAILEKPEFGIPELILSRGVNSPSEQTAGAPESDVPMLQARLFPTDSGILTSLTVTASGSGDDVSGVSAVRLYEDVDGDGHGDRPLGSSTFLSDNGTARFSELNVALAPNVPVDLVVTCSFSKTPEAGRTFTANINSAADVTATGAFPFTVSGAPVEGATVTIREPKPANDTPAEVVVASVDADLRPSDTPVAPIDDEPVTTETAVSKPNAKPRKPELRLPEDNAVVDAVEEELTLGDFSDFDGDSQCFTEWQVTDESGQFDNEHMQVNRITAEKEGVRKLRLPKGSVPGGRDWVWRARVGDCRGEWSDWSDDRRFTTMPDKIKIEPVKEKLKTNADAPDPRPVKFKLKDASGERIATLSGVKYTDEVSDSGESQHPESDFRFGLFAFTIDHVEIGGAVTVQFELPEPLPEEARYLMWDSARTRWIDLTSDVSGLDGDTLVSLTLRDGGPGDMDGVANGVIVDPGGFAAPQWSSAPSRDSKKSFAACLISRHVSDMGLLTIARQFRDRLLDMPAGRILVEAYYRASQGEFNSAASTIGVLFGAASPAYAEENPPYRESGFDVEARVSDLLSRMTLDEKISILAGNGRENGFNSRAVERLGIPELKMTDGPQGVRWDHTTAFPSGVAMAATWDPDLIKRLGEALAEEVKGKGRNIILGPCVNIHRLPLGGRNFESFGEDPYLAARTTVGYITGVQSKGVAATVKHFAVNNQEYTRGDVDVKIDERALHEIYFPAFKAAVQDAGCLAVMSAYNKVNGFWCAENPYLLTETLRNRWGFRGIVMSDWGGVHSRVPTVNAGLDIEMPDPKHLNAEISNEIKNGVIDTATVDEHVRHILRVIFTLGLFDHPSDPDPSMINTPEHREVARRVAEDAVVLLKNDHAALPIDLAATKRVAVIGPNAAQARVHGGGSGHVEPERAVAPLDAIRALVGDRVEIVYALGAESAGEISPIEPEFLTPADGGPGVHGLHAEYFSNQYLQGEPTLVRIDPQINFSFRPSPAPEIPADSFSARWTGFLTPARGGPYEISASSDDGSRVYLDGRQIIDNWRDHAEEAVKSTVTLEAGRRYAIKVEFYENWGGAIARLGWHHVDAADARLREAVRAAKEADVAVVFAGLSDRFETEGRDRDTLALPAGQDELIDAVARANPNTVVVLNNGGPVLMNRWIDRVAAVVEAWYPGEEGGAAISNVLFGRVNPSGKLPTTIPKSWESSPAYGNYPGENLVVHYAEGIYVGYRYFDARKIEPLFPFGHGLSYTTFAYSNLSVTPAGLGHSPEVSVSFDLENTGSRAGAEVAQVYVADDTSRIDRPPKELKAFRKIMLQPGEKRRVSLDLNRDAFAYFDPEAHDWAVEPGAFTILVGSSSRDIRLQGSLAYPPMEMR